MGIWKGDVIVKLNVTNTAIEQIKSIMEKKDAFDKKIRLYVSGYGWGGPSYGIALDEQHNEDKTQDIDGITFLVDENLVDQVDAFNVDYTKDWTGKGFRVTTGNSSSC